MLQVSDKTRLEFGRSSDPPGGNECMCSRGEANDANFNQHSKKYFLKNPPVSASKL
jgi:hypothetical protein